MEFIITYTPCASEEEAKNIAKHLLEKKLIACANIFRSQSIYRWKGKIKDENEWILICKTGQEKYEIVKNEIELVHSYDIPAIIRIPADGNERYCNWLRGELE